MLPTTEDFQTELDRIFKQSVNLELEFVDLTSGPVHRSLGGYPGTNHRMPVCCKAMRTNMKLGDEILHQPPKGNGATLCIRYRLPR